MATIEVRVPDIGDFEAVEIIEVLVAEGDRVETETALITLESDKATMDVPSPEAGVVASLKVKLGDKVAEGDLVLILETAETAAEPEKTDEETAPAPAAAMSEVQAAEPAVRSPSAATAVSSKTDIDVHVPDIGDFDSVEIIEVLVAEGDVVDTEAPLLTLESDKATMDVPAPVAGTVKSLKVKVGDKVAEGDLILVLESGSAEAEDASPPPVQTAQPPRAETAPAAAEPAPPVAESARLDETAFAKVHASPSVRRYAREHGVDLGRVKASGPKERITREDVTAFIKATMSTPVQTGGGGLPQMPAVNFSKFGDTETIPLPRIRKLSAANLHRNWVVVPHVTQFDEADITELEDFRKESKADAEKEGIKLTMLAFLLKVSANTLLEFPELNSSLAPDGENLILKKYVNVGVAIDTQNGLVVPVIRDVDKKGLFQIAKELGEVSTKAREGKLSPVDMQGGCFSISSLGGIGGTMFTPIVNAPEVAILGVSKSQMKPVWNGKEFEPRLMLPLSLSYDHRVIDGAQAARITGYLAELLSDIRRALL